MKKPSNTSASIVENITKTISAGELEDAGNYVQLEIGSILSSRYKILDKLGEGGMGVVYAGQDLQLHRPVAIKLLKKDVSNNKEAVSKLKEEAQVSMMLTHPLIMRLINFEHDEGKAFLLMEYIEGNDLKTIAGRKDGKKLDPKIVANVAYKVCLALDYAHSKRVIHRDIKPANIMISAKNEVKLMDFGIARVLAEATGEHRKIAGTMHYIAPEVFNGAMPDVRCDLYALGVTMYELLAGVTPFTGSNPREVIDQHFHKTPEPISDLDRGLSKIVFTLLEKMPNARYQTAQEMLSELSKYLGLDKEEQVSKMQQKVDRDKRQLELERRKVELQLEQMKDDRKMLKKKLKQAESMSKVNISSKLTNNDSRSIFSFSQLSILVLLLAAVAGFIAEASYEFINNGLQSLPFKEKEPIAWAAVGMLILGIPALIKDRLVTAFFGTLAGAIAGYIAFPLASILSDLIFGSSLTISISVVDYVALGIMLSVGAAYMMFRNNSMRTGIKAFLFSSILVVLTACLPHFAFAEKVLGIDMGSAGFFYMPLLAVAIWFGASVAD